MRLEFKPAAFEDLKYWVAHQPKVAKKLMRLIEESQKNPYGGIGKPEPLKNELSGWWSKRIDGEHRLIYKVEGEVLIIAQARGHYGDK
ncbi:Txe/YoeB family addiction module toxin [Persicirhabdus sediminis]|uniref:Putative mRNA interferase YoeB n=1 Tax=Persicirhabdus sediminis TaxID=454144 RepID=A0A8J7MH66_9BACT|nr:Txe/YoeB family addiction module toxin [Persicirhabdus sediminis]MBK1792758.1 Txe/YoeB family addiction module toxin [Persicirhabdus sediminis]